MFTLLPADFKKSLMRKYRMRLATLGTLLGALLLAISISLFVPSFLTVKAEHDRLSKEEEAVLGSISRKNKGNFSSTLDGLNSDIALIAQPDRQISPVFAKVDARVLPGIKLNRIAYTASADQSFSLLVSGIAATRKDLSAFVKSLKDETAFSSVELPLNDLTKDTEAPFTISITGAQQ